MAAGAFTLVVGCGSGFSSTTHDGGGVKDGGAEAPATDTGSDGSDGSDTGSDTGVDAPAKDAGWCGAQHATFCEDFDETSDVTTFLGSWTTFTQTGGNFSFDSTDKLVPSPPNALRVQAGNGAEVLVVKSFHPLKSKPSALTLSFDLKINSPGKVAVLSVAAFAAIAYGTGIEDGYVALGITNDFGNKLAGFWSAPTDIDAGSGKPSDGQESMAAFPSSGNWSHFSIVIAFAAHGACLQAYEGPNPLLSPCMVLPPSLSDPESVSIGVGDVAAGLSTGNIDFEFDNLVYEVTP